MAFLDVSELLTDPMLCDQLTLIRSAQTIAANGEASNTETSSTIYGVVCHLNADDLKELANGSYVEGMIRIHTRAKLISAKEGYDADVIVWNDDSYQVSKVDFYGKFGVGFTVGYCTPFAVSGGEYHG